MRVLVGPELTVGQPGEHLPKTPDSVDLFTDVSRLWQMWKSLDRLLNQWCEKWPTNSIQTPTQTHTDEHYFRAWFVWRSVFGTSDDERVENHLVQRRDSVAQRLGNLWDSQTATANSAWSSSLFYICPYTPLHSQHTPASPPPLLITAHAGVDSCCIACRLVIFPSGCTFPDFTAFTPKTALKTLFTADCGAQNCSRTSTNPKHRAAQFQRFKGSVSKADAPANGRRQRSEAACQLQLISASGN